MTVCARDKTAVPSSPKRDSAGPGRRACTTLPQYALVARPYSGREFLWRRSTQSSAIANITVTLLIAQDNFVKKYLRFHPS